MSVCLQFQVYRDGIGYSLGFVYRLSVIVCILEGNNGVCWEFGFLVCGI